MKKITRKSLALLLTAMMLFSAVPLTASAATYGDLTYFVSNGEVTITDCNESATEVEIPAEIDGYPVTNIFDSTFTSCNSITGIIVDENNNYFSNDEYGVLFNKDKTQLIQYPTGNTRTSYVIPDSVSSIGSYAFLYCISLTSILVDENNNHYSNDEYGVLFNKDKTQLIQYPTGNTRTSYVIPDSVSNIGEYAFAYCYSIKNVTVPDSVTYFGKSAFSQCRELESITLPDKVQILETGLFNGCKKLSDITIPESVTAIYWDVFYYCTSLEYICIPENVKEIKGNPFGLCYNLKSIEVDDGNEYFCSKDGVLFTKDMTELIAYPGAKSDTSYTIPEPVSEIREFCFHGISNLEKLGIPVTVKEIGNIAFSYHQNMILDLHIYYAGNKEQWSNVRFLDNNTSERIKFPKLHYNCYPVKEYSVEISPGEHYEIREITYTCECGFSYIGKTNPTPHLYNHILKTVPPDCTTGGYTIYSCECGDSYISGYVTMLGHSFGEWKTNGIKSTRTCIRCKTVETKISTDLGDVEIESPEQPDKDFTVDVIVPGGEEYVIIQGNLDNGIDCDYEIVKAFDINLKNKDGVHIQPDGTVKVKLPNDWTNDSDYNVYRVNDDGTLTNMNAYRQGSHMVFDTDHFSIYVIVEEKTEDAPSKPVTPSDNCSHMCHKTGFVGFFWKIINFLQRIFGTGKYCECGAAHY